MKKYLFIALLTALLFSCKEPKEPIPANVLPMNKMVNILIDIHLIEANLSTKNLAKDTGVLFYNFYEKDLYKKHNTNDSTYNRSFIYYSAHPQLMDQIYEKVVDSLSLLEGEAK